MPANQFRALVLLSGWSQAEVSRRLQITPGAVSQLFSGATRPRPATLNLLKLILEKERPDAIKSFERTSRGDSAAWESRLLERLSELPDPEREKCLGVFHKLLDLLPRAARRQAK